MSTFFSLNDFRNLPHPIHLSPESPPCGQDFSKLRQCENLEVCTWMGTFSSKPQSLWGSKFRGLGPHVGTSGMVNLSTLSRVQLCFCEPPTQPRCAGGRSRLCGAKSCRAARWRHSCSSACRPGPLQIRVCGKRGGAETRPVRGEDGPAGQTDRGPGGRRAAQRSHIPPWIRRQPGPGLPTCPPGGS